MTDVAVIGAGIVGLATAHALTERDVPVVVYERGVPGNGQSGGESRILRHAHDDSRLVALARDARRGWRAWEERFGRELLSRDGVVAIGPAAERRLPLMVERGIRAVPVGTAGIAQRLPVLAERHAPAVADEDGGVIRARAAVEALTDALRDRFVFDEVLGVRALPGGAAEVRAGDGTVEHGCVVVCAGRGTAALARGAGLPLPVRLSAHVRHTYRVRGEPPGRLACLLDGEAGAYGDPLPGNREYAVGLGEAPAHEDGSLHDPAELAVLSERVDAYVAGALPGLDPAPVGARHCWVTELPWSPDGLAVWEAGPLWFAAGNNLFKHAPELGRLLARAAVGEGLADDLRPQAKLGRG